MKLTIDYLGGNCPVQGEGFVDSKPFYFRARGEHWSFSVAATESGDPVDVSAFGGADGGFYYEEEYGDEPFVAGWMSQEEARTFIEKAAALYATASTPTHGSE